MNISQVKYPLMLFLLCSSSVHAQSIILRGDDIVHQHFERSEIQHLERVLTFFDEEIRFIVGGNQEVQDNYTRFSNLLKKAASQEQPLMPVLRMRTENLERLLSSLPDNIKREIWRTSSLVDLSTGDTLRVCDISPDGKYTAFLHTASRNNPMLSEYHNAFIQSGMVSPYMEAIMLHKFDRLNINRERERLIAAIHFICIRQTAWLQGHSAESQ